MKTSITLLLVFAVISCGFKGPLYMPKQDKPNSSMPTNAKLTFNTKGLHSESNESNNK